MDKIRIRIHSELSHKHANTYHFTVESMGKVVLVMDLIGLRIGACTNLYGVCASIMHNNNQVSVYMVARVA